MTHNSGVSRCENVKPRLGRVRVKPSVVIARESGRSSTPRPSGSSTAVSGILGRPVEPGDDSGSRHYRLDIG
jgi:hypothetical protein